MDHHSPTTIARAVAPAHRPDVLDRELAGGWLAGWLGNQTGLLPR